jgi:hypothetical protein
MTDNIWIKNDDQDISWHSIDPKHISLSNIITHIALKGSSNFGQDSLLLVAERNALMLVFSLTNMLYLS